MLAPFKKPDNAAAGPTTNSPKNLPKIDSISPSSPVDVIGDQNVLVLGKNFPEDMRIKVTFPDGGTSTLCCAQIMKLTATSFVILIDFNGNPGRYGIQIIDTDGETSDSFSFVAKHAVQDPKITFIVPSNPRASKEEQSIQVYGFSFQKGFTIKITFPNGQSATLSGRQIPEQTPQSFRMLVYFNGDPGSYSIQVINPNGRKSNSFAFKVI